MKWNIIVLVVLFGLLPLAASRHGSKGKKTHKKVEVDRIVQAKCDIECKDITTKKARAKCVKQCFATHEKLGTCPVPVNSKWAAACIEACNSDSQCKGTEKCCKDSCGRSCKDPEDILTLPGLPELPVIKNVKERKGRSRGITISWSSGVGDRARTVPGKTLYIVEEQHHMGPVYEADRLGRWHFLKRTKRNKIHVDNRLKRGYWYRFRVAAVNASGSRGFSEASGPFSPRGGPNRPPKPKNLKVLPLLVENGTETIRVEWKPNTESDLPVKKYKVFWSRRVRGLGGELDSVLVNYQSVPSEQTYYVIRDLEPNSTYFIQVQTVSEFGFNRLKSDKEAIFYNTSSIYIKPEQPKPTRFKLGDIRALSASIKEDLLQGIKGLRLDNIKLAGAEIKAQISWDPAINGYYSPQRYYIHWTKMKCKNENSPTGSFTDTTNETWFEIYDLAFNCSYRISVNQSLKPQSLDPYILVTVPSCKYFQMKTATPLEC